MIRITPPILCRSAIALAALSSLTGCFDDGNAPDLNVPVSGVTQVSLNTYSATTVGTGTTAATQDLLTGGLGKSGLVVAAPAYADPLNPTALELRRNALYANYRAIVDPSVGGGFTRLYGPNIDFNGGDTLGEGLIPGKEYVAILDDGTGRKNTVIAVQIPARFDVNNPCIIAGPSSGSRGVYGAIATAGEWGLKKGCAVVLTDAGKGMGLYDPTDDTVNRIDGTRATRTAAGALSHFAANITDAARSIYNAAFPNRLALKQVHSQLNPQKDWGSDTLVSVRYALYVLNQEYGDLSPIGARIARFNAANTTVIAASASNGGGAVLQAAELDTDGLIDGIVADEPLAQPATTVGYSVNFAGAPVASYGKPTAEYFTIANLYQPCAALAPAVALTEATFFNYIGLTAQNGRAVNRCTALAAKGLVSGDTTALQAAAALAKLRAAGYTPDNDTMHNAHYGLGNAAIIGAMYTTGYGRFSLTDNVCNTSFAQVDATGAVVAVAPTTKAASFAIGNGTANGQPASVVMNNSVGGARSWNIAVSPSSGLADFGLDMALCERALVTGVDPVSGTALTAATTPTLAQSQAVQAGIKEVGLSGNLRGKPTLMLAGRSDALVAINHSERAYAAYNRMVEGTASQLSYIEVVNAQHFDAFVSLAGWDTRFVPLHVYFNQAMASMYAKLKSNAALPASQVVRTTVRGGTPGAAPALTAANVPPYVPAPAAADAITFSGTALNIPN